MTSKSPSSKLPSSRLVIEQAYNKGPIMVTRRELITSNHSNSAPAEGVKVQPIFTSSSDTITDGSYQRSLEQRAKARSKSIPKRKFAGVKNVNGELVVIWEVVE